VPGRDARRATRKRERTMIIKSVRVLSLAKVMGCIYASIGLVFGLIFSLVSVFGVAMGSMFQHANGSPDAIFGPLFGLLFGLGAVIVLPIFYGVMGFLGGLLISVIYNFVANTFGGLELEVE
jgi:hypothetical protein